MSSGLYIVGICFIEQIRKVFYELIQIHLL